MCTRTLECLADISAMIANHLKLNLSKTELLFIPGKDCPRMDLSVTVEDVMVLPFDAEEPGCFPRRRTVLHPQNCPLQHLQDLVFFQSIQILPCDLLWLPVGARIWFKMVKLAFKTVKRTRSIFLKTLVKQARALSSTTSAGRLVPSSLRENKAH